VKQQAWSLRSEGLFQTFLDLFEKRPAGKKTTVRKASIESWTGAIGTATFLND